MISTNNIIAVDGSFSGMGVFIQVMGTPFFDPDLPFKIKVQNYIHHDMKMTRIFAKLRSETRPRDFTHCVVAGREQAHKLQTLISMTGIPKFDIVALETPPPIGQYAMGLGVLDMQLLAQLRSWGNEVWLIPPNAINNWLGKRKVPKGNITKHVQEGLFANLLPFRLNHDEASAFLLAEIVKGRANGPFKKPKIFRVDSSLFSKAFL